VPTTPNDPATAANRAAWKVLEQWQKPFLTCFSKGDPITRGGDVYMRARIPGANDQQHITVRGGHFLQENSPKELSEAINALVKTLG
jgi:haloalkane dehalogenase